MKNNYREHMNYLTVAISSVAKRPNYIILFILFNSLGLPVSIMKQIGMVQGLLALALMICIFVISTFLETGVYTLSWKYIKGEKETFIAGAKRYFPHVLGASIVIGIIAAFAVFLFLAIHKLVILPDISAQLYHKRIDAIVMRNIPELIISVFFVYAIPAIFARNLSGKNAVANSWRFVLKYFAESRIVIILLLISTISKIVFTQWAVNFDYSSIEYWQINALSSILTSALLFLTFLAAAQIFDKLFEENESI
jgi:hypothetical protein